MRLVNLEEFPTTVFGGFAPWRVKQILKLVRRHPEYHIVTCLEPDLYVNTFVPNAQTYFLAEGDRDPRLIFDPQCKLDESFLYSLNSGRRSRIA